ncbi:hypothetical protein K439DRAFT_1644924 [Ramaria rubella]|nr:hypothetical protein K439DRAFT_1644924 [Ramaria rubella]
MASPSPPPPSSKPRRSSDSRRRRAAAPSAATAAHDAAAQSPPPPPVSAGRLVYSLPPLPSMNPNYHSPYLPPQHYPHHLSPAPAPANGQHMPAHMPAMYPYAMPPHPPPHYPHHPTATTSTAPSAPAASRPAPPDARAPSPPHPPPPRPARKGPKRKRKSEDRTKSEEDNDSAELKKRTKTQRACDSCRSRKIRCDVLPDSDPPQCQHCKQYGFDCTFFLPITETRFKKKRLEEEAAAAAAAAGDKGVPDAKAETKVLGPTSAAFLLHSTATVPSRAYEGYDLRYHHTWEVSKSGDSFIQRDVVERLVNSYFNNLAPVFAVVTRDEFLSSPSPPPVLLYAICCVAAARRDVPAPIFDTLRSAVSTLIKTEDVLSTASTVNVQALLVLGMCGDCHSPFMPNALSAFWLRLGTAFRMAQDLGLHRAESVKQNLALRRRLWAACVISDRWCSLTYGHPFMIDVEDCDVRLTSSDALLKLSILLGRVLKMIYSPSGLLLADIDTWNASLPPALHYTGPTAPQHAGLLHLFYSCVCMLFWRVFMRISYTVPAHLKFALSIERWSALVSLSREAIEWVDAHEECWDVWMLVSYCAVSCALVQYHTWARRQDPDAAATLRKLRDCIKRWESTLQPEHRSTRRKTGEIIALLYESTQTPLIPHPTTTTNPTSTTSTAPTTTTTTAPTTSTLNPTVGVRPRGKFPEALRGLMFRKDPGQPGGGVFVAAERPGGDYSDLPKGTIVLRGERGEGGTGGVRVRVLVLVWRVGPTPSLVNYTPLPNVNPTLNGHAPQIQFAVTDNGLLEGIPGGMFDWDQWDTFFARFALAQDGAGAGQQGRGGQGEPGEGQSRTQGQGQGQAQGQGQGQGQEGTTRASEEGGQK